MPSPDAKNMLPECKKKEECSRPFTPSNPSEILLIL